MDIFHCKLCLGHQGIIAKNKLNYQMAERAESILLSAPNVVIVHSFKCLIMKNLTLKANLALQSKILKHRYEVYLFPSDALPITRRTAKWTGHCAACPPIQFRDSSTHRLRTGLNIQELLWFWKTLRRESRNSTSQPWTPSTRLAAAEKAANIIKEPSHPR